MTKHPEHIPDELAEEGQPYFTPEEVSLILNKYQTHGLVPRLLRKHGPNTFDGQLAGQTDPNILSGLKSYPDKKIHAQVPLNILVTPIIGWNNLLNLDRCFATAQVINTGIKIAREKGLISYDERRTPLGLEIYLTYLPSIAELLRKEKESGIPIRRFHWPFSVKTRGRKLLNSLEKSRRLLVYATGRHAGPHFIESHEKELPTFINTLERPVTLHDDQLSDLDGTGLLPQINPQLVLIENGYIKDRELDIRREGIASIFSNIEKVCRERRFHITFDTAHFAANFFRVHDRAEAIIQEKNKFFVTAIQATLAPIADLIRNVHVCELRKVQYSQSRFGRFLYHGNDHYQDNLPLTRSTPKSPRLVRPEFLLRKIIRGNLFHPEIQLSLETYPAELHPERSLLTAVKDIIFLIQILEQTFIWK